MTTHRPGVTNKHDYNDLPLRGASVSRCYLDYRFGLQFFALADPIEIAIAGAFTVTTASGVVSIEPEKPATIGAALCLVHEAVKTARAYQDGSLEIVFADGRRLDVPPDATYEPWEVTSQSGMRLVSLPGGSLAVWSAVGGAPPATTG